MTFLDRIRALSTFDNIPNLAKVDALIDEFYRMPGNGAGGSLHNVLDDTNIDTDSIEWCRDYAKKHGDENGVALAELLLRIPIAQRVEMKFICPCCREDVRAEIAEGELT